MSQFLKFYFTSSVLNMFQTLIHPSCDFSICVAGWSTSCASACHTDTTPTSHNETPTHIETRTHNQYGDTVEKSQVPDDGCINVRNMLSTEVKKKKLKKLWHQVGLLFFSYHNDAQSNIRKIS